jgi:site-specific DNA-adenine methylase
MAGLRTGYPGLTHTAKDIAAFIGFCDVFCEPFAGMGRVSAHISANKIILNDMSDYAVSKLTEDFPLGVVTQEDFMTCIKRWDAENVTFLFDPPWARKDYADNEKTFCDRGVGEYYKQLASIVPTLKGKWFCAGRFSGGARSTVSVYFKDYPHTVVYSERTINGHPIKTKVYYGGGYDRSRKADESGQNHRDKPVHKSSFDYHAEGIQE